jgi:oligopeptide transport system substrate-binding protein
MKKFKYLLVGLATVALLAACGGSDSKESTQAVDSQKKILNVATDIELASMDTGVATDGYSFDAIAAVIEGLYQLDSDGNPIPGMAESTEVSEDGKTYTFKLRDAKWSDGTPVKANDFVFAWRRLADPATASEYSYMLDVAGIKNASEIAKGEKAKEELGITAIDDKTLKVELNYAVPFFYQLMAFPSFYPISEEFYKKHEDQYALTPEAILANGPFKMTAWNQGSGYELVKNDTYYDSGVVKLDGINVQLVKDSQSAVVAYEQGTVDVMKLTGELVEQYKGSPEMRNTLGGYLWYVSPNTKVPGLENPNLRLALALSYDKEQIAEHLLKDGSIAANFAVPVKLAVGPDKKDFRATSPEYLKVDKAKAKEYYEIAKKELGKDSFNFELLFEDTEASKKVAEYLKSEIETNLPGVTLTLKQQPKKSRLQLMQKGEFDLGLTRWGPDYADPMTYLDMWVSGASYNFGSWSNEKYDELVFEASKGSLVTKLEERWQALKDAEKIVMDEAAILPVYQTGSAMMIKSNVKGIEFHSVGVPTVYKNTTKD